MQRVVKITEWVVKSISNSITIIDRAHLLSRGGPIFNVSVRQALLRI